MSLCLGQLVLPPGDENNQMIPLQTALDVPYPKHKQTCVAMSIQSRGFCHTRAQKHEWIKLLLRELKINEPNESYRDKLILTEIAAFTAFFKADPSKNIVSIHPRFRQWQELSRDSRLPLFGATHSIVPSWKAPLPPQSDLKWAE